jgi:hypothetical protein
MTETGNRRDGWFNMACWNGLSRFQQARLLVIGNLPLGYKPEGSCPNGAEVGIETQGDSAPGPRFYCVKCAVYYLEAVWDGSDLLPELTQEEQIELKKLKEAYS